MDTAPRRVRLELDDDAIIFHEPPAALQQALASPDIRRTLWYTGSDIRRIKQAAVPVLTRLDNNKSVSHAIEVDWRTGTTSVRGLEFGSRAGQQRKRATRQFQRLVLQEQARLRQEEQDEDAVSILAACASQAALPAVHLALDLAIEDAAFVCQYVENVARVVTAPVRSPPIVVMVLRRMVQSARHNMQRQKSQRHLNRRAGLQKTKSGSALRVRCDTESTTTIMACT